MEHRNRHHKGANELDTSLNNENNMLKCGNYKL